MSAPRTLPPTLARAVAPALLAIYASSLLLPRVRASTALFWSIAGSALLLGALIGLTALAARRRGETLGVQWVVRRAHVVQVVMHGSVFAYWGWHWELVYPQLALIVVQVAFAYLVELAISWRRYGNVRLGFGPWPVVGSTNLFLWFKDDLFWAQLAMIALAYVARETLRWTREGRQVHIFNPSAIAISVAAIALIATESVHLTWGPEISISLGYGALAYEQIFLAGVVVQLFFAVGLVTASAAISAVVFGYAWYVLTGTWFFVDTAIPIAVFLGMTLLVTDPVSSPYRDGAKIAFGVLYTVGVMALYVALRAIERPDLGDDPGLSAAFFDKVLLVPVLNLTVRGLDRTFGRIPVRRWTDALVRRIRPSGPPMVTGPAALYAGGGFAHRALHVAIWAGAFLVMRPQLVDNPGQSVSFWADACAGATPEAAPDICENRRRVLVAHCRREAAEACHNLGVIYQHGEHTAPDVELAGLYYERGCEQGFAASCSHLGGLIMTTARGPEAHRTARGLFEEACASGSAEGCLRWGVTLEQGLGGPADRRGAAKAYARGCEAGDGQSCYQSGRLLLAGGQPALGRAQMRAACDAGFQPACDRVPQ